MAADLGGTGASAQEAAVGADAERLNWQHPAQIRRRVGERATSSTCEPEALTGPTAAPEEGPRRCAYDTLGPDYLDIAVLAWLQLYFPAAETARYQSALQPRGALRDAATPFQALHAVLLMVGTAGSVGIMLRCWRDRALAGLAALALTAMVANAFATGALSGPHHRYRARIAWLVLLPPLFYAARAETSAGLMRTRLS